MIVRLSTKGQLVIPKEIRKTLALEPGDQFDVRVEDCKIILEPMEYSSAIEFLSGRYAHLDLLSDLEEEHRWELNREDALRP